MNAVRNIINKAVLKSLFYFLTGFYKLVTSSDLAEAVENQLRVSLEIGEGIGIEAGLEEKMLKLLLVMLRKRRALIRRMKKWR